MDEHCGILQSPISSPLKTFKENFKDLHFRSFTVKSKNNQMKSYKLLFLQNNMVWYD